MFTQYNTSTKMSLFTGNHVVKNRRCCDSIRCCAIATMDYGTDPISSFLYIYAAEHIHTDTKEMYRHAHTAITKLHWCYFQLEIVQAVVWKLYFSVKSKILMYEVHQSISCYEFANHNKISPNPETQSMALSPSFPESMNKKHVAY